MRVLVTGGRDYARRDYLFGALDMLDAKVRIETIIHGDYRGADTLADQWAKRRRREPLPFPPTGPWPQAGPLRNQRMLDDGHPDLVVAFPGGPGTSDMVRR